MNVRYTDITFRPIDQWPGELTPYRVRSPFFAKWGQTITLLERELSHLDARNVVFQLALVERDFRIDGKPRAQARAEHPGAIIAFDSKYGPLKYAVDRFTSWDDNVRAIALAMEALRKVDRYGVTKRGEQYTGWKAIPQTTSGDPGSLINTRDDAVRVLLEFTGDMYHAGHGEGTLEHDVARRHANGGLLWWDPPIILVDGKPHIPPTEPFMLLGEEVS